MKPSSILTAARVGAIWLTLILLSVSGFAAARPEPAPSPEDRAGEPAAVGSSAGYRAGLAVTAIATPPRASGPAAQWTALVSEYFESADVPRALDVIFCESSGRPNITNPVSGASGLFQHMPDFWGERAASAGMAGKTPSDPRANIAVAAWLVYEGGGWHHWAASSGCWSGLGS